MLSIYESWLWPTYFLMHVCDTLSFFAILCVRSCVIYIAHIYYSTYCYSLNYQCVIIRSWVCKYHKVLSKYQRCRDSDCRPTASCWDRDLSDPMRHFFNSVVLQDNVIMCCMYVCRIIFIFLSLNKNKSMKVLNSPHDHPLEPASVFGVSEPI